MKTLILAACAALLLASPLEAQETPVQDGPDRRVQADEIDRYITEKKVFFLDVREPKEIEELGTLEGYHNIPIGELEKRLGEIPRDRLILTA
jgi:predicted sulfurtransferase